ncbi:MAG: radical SAM protein [Clostridia bacterium]|nr:radical SAM protein [Clostridia bacterium]
MLVYVNSIKFNRSLVDGPGVRTVVFFQGCDLRCKGCQNPSTWEMKNGTEMTTDELVTILEKEVVNKKVTFSGGEPLMQVDALIDIVKKLEGFDIAVYTGHGFEEVPQELLDNIKYIKTGSFKEELKSTVKPYVGSTNQEFRRVK